MDNDYYTRLVKKSVINENYADKTHDELRNSKLIDCNKIEDFYIDSLFYLHLHFSLYLELLHFNVRNNFDIHAFTGLFNSLNLKFITDTQNLESTSLLTNIVSYKLLSITINSGGSGYTSEPKIKFITDGRAEDVGTTTLNSGFPSSLNTGITGSSGHTFQNGDVITFSTPTGGRAAVGIINISSSLITSINFSDRGNGYAVLSGASTTTATSTTTVTDALGSSQTRTGTITITFTPVNYVKTASVTNISKVYTKSGTFSIELPPAGRDTATILPVTNISSIGYLDNSTYIFNLSIFNSYYNSVIQYSNESEKSKLISSRVPRISNISSYETQNPLFNITRQGTSGSATAYNKASLSTYSNSNDERLTRFENVLKIILAQDVKNILGYLAYQVRYYNIIVLNTSIQRMIYKHYLNNNAINMNIAGIFEDGSTNVNILRGIQEHIDDMKTNLTAIITDIKSVNNIYSQTKENYPAKIDKLDKNEIKYKTTQDALNNTAKNYNQYYNNYNKLKIYASSIIVFLVILIIATIVITVLPYFNANSKNTYYILVLILLIILTVLYYNNFSHVNLYEKFVSSPLLLPLSFNIPNCSDKNNYNFNTGDVSRNNTNKANNYKFFNDITPNISQYNNEYSDINTQMSSGIYTTDNTIYEQQADNYLSSMYIDKKRRIDLFRIKRTSLVNLIEAIKQRILYLFNIIFIICLLTIVLLIALILYVNMPQALNIIIIFVSIAIFLIIIYYIYTVVQPTRMIANKNYWANKNPSQETYNKL